MEQSNRETGPPSAQPNEASARAEAMWQAARLAALVVAAGRLGHDLRGALAPALLMGERLQSHADPAVRRGGDSVVRAVDRASELVRAMVDYAREVPTGLQREPLALRSTVDQAVAEAGVAVANAVEAGLWAEGDRASVAGALAHLLRHAAARGARQIRIGGTTEPGPATLLIEDDGPGLADPVQRHLFRPFMPGEGSGGAGLDLATARELIRANGGDLVLHATGPAGTCFRVTLPRSRREV
jgi:signal transduction histidine kinase